MKFNARDVSHAKEIQTLPTNKLRNTPQGTTYERRNTIHTDSLHKDIVNYGK